MKRELDPHQNHNLQPLPDSSVSGSSSTGKAKMCWEEEVQQHGGMDELLAVLGYQVRASDMAEVAQKLELLEDLMGNAQGDGLSHLASDMAEVAQKLELLEKVMGNAQAASAPRRSRVGAVSEKRKKKKKKGHRRTPESGASWPFRCPTRVGHGHDAKNGVSVQPRILILPVGFKWIYHEDLMQTLAHQLVKKLWEHVLELQDSDISKLIREPSRLLFDAAELGSLEFLIILIDSYPDLIWKIDHKNRSLFHIAVLNRHESIFNLIYEIGAIKDLIAAYKDENNNNILHLAANLAPLSRLQIVSGAALQMQRELLWFKGVEKIVPPSYIKMKNSDDQTPKDLFTEKHKELLKEGEKWMKSTATSCMLVATLIATVVFAAIFTLPGGNNNDNVNGAPPSPPPFLEKGAPLFLEKKWFLIFVISDAVALFSSTASIIMFLSILTSRYAENDFLVSLPARLMFGLSALFVSIATMVLAYGAAIFMIYDHKFGWVPIVIVSLACVIVALFAWQHFHLWADTIRSTYWSRYLFQPKHRLYH